MRGAWFFLFSCATLALSSGGSRYTRQEPECLVYSTATLEEAVNLVHSRLDRKFPGQPDREYGYGSERADPPEDESESTHESGITALRNALNGQKRAKRDDDYATRLKPIDMNFGDMTSIYDEKSTEPDSPVRNITCVEYKDGETFPVDLTPYLRKILDLKLFFDNIFKK